MRCGFLFAIFLGLTALTLDAADPTIAPGTTFPTFTVGATTYHDVQIRSINARTVILTHRGGMASVPLRTLSPEWQARFGYDPASEISPASSTTPRPSSPPPRTTRSTAPRQDRPFAAFLRQLGQPAALNDVVDLRPKFFALELNVKNQGRRPSCAIFAVVSALEFQQAELTGTPQKFSEEYLSWATVRTIRRVFDPASPQPAPEAADAIDDADAGFTLHEVVAALRGYGIALQSSMPNTRSIALGAIAEPAPAIVDEARRQTNVFIHELPGRDLPTRINNIVHALNANVPVVIGVAWPNYRSLRTGYLNRQTPIPGYGHAVTLVGYKSPTGKLTDAVFIFKNSWGIQWGQGGYGWVTYEYLNKHLSSAVVLELQPPGPARQL